jgi:uncharacterized repeat protein (TIGR01451 family)
LIEVIASMAFAALGEGMAILAAPLAVPPLPNTYYGAVTVDGNPAPIGATVIAWVNNLQVTATVTVLDNGAAVYTINVPGDDPETTPVEGGVVGDVIQFQVNGQAATPTALWQIGALTQLNLNVSPPAPAPSSLLIELDADPPAGSPIGVGDLITYTLVLSHTGDLVQTNVVVTAAVPADAAYIVDSARPQATYIPPNPSIFAVGGGALTWTVAMLNVGGSYQARFTVRMMASSADMVTLQVTAHSDQAGAPASQSVSHRFTPTALEDEDEPTARYFFFLPFLFR